MFFSHRLFIRLDLFIYKIINSSTPPILNECLIVDSSDNIANRLKSRRKKLNYEPNFTTGFGYKTFEFFSSIFYNKFLLSKRHTSLFSFKNDLFNNLGTVIPYL
jgi:hypothetical protein